MPEWFGGKVSLEDRIIGLDLIHEEAPGKTILDLGCAEGAISQWLLDAGATHATGIEKDLGRIKQGQDATKVHFHAADLNDLKTVPFLKKHDIVLCLAILQKVKDPANLLDYAIDHTREWLVTRAPNSVVRSKGKNGGVSINRRVCNSGFERIFVIKKPVYIAIFRRV